MSINIAVLIRRQVKDETYILSTFRDKVVLDTNTYRDFQTENSLKEFIENNLLDTLNLLRQIIREAFSSVSPYERPAGIITTLLFNLQ
jgi:hypothetical protein